MSTASSPPGNGTRFHNSSMMLQSRSPSNSEVLPSSEERSPLFSRRNPPARFDLEPEREEEVVMIATPPVLALPARGGRFVVEIDASDGQLGIVLSQEDESQQDHLARFYSTRVESNRGFWFSCALPVRRKLWRPFGALQLRSGLTARSTTISSRTGMPQTVDIQVQYQVGRNPLSDQT